MCKIVHSYRACRHAHYGETIPCPFDGCNAETVMTYRGDCTNCKNARRLGQIYTAHPNNGDWDNSKYHKKHGHAGPSCFELIPAKGGTKKPVEEAATHVDGAGEQPGYGEPIKFGKHGQHGKKISFAGMFLSNNSSEAAFGNRSGMNDEDMEMGHMRQQKYGRNTAATGGTIGKAI